MRVGTALGVALIIGGCAQAPGRVVVVVGSDIPWPDDLARVVARVERVDVVDSPPLLATFDLGETGGDTRRHRLPLSFAIRPTALDVRVRVVVEGLSATAPTALVTQSASVRIVPGPTRTLPMFLAAACRAVRCGDGLTCVDGECVSTPSYDLEDPAGLSAIGAPGDELRDAGAPDARAAADGGAAERITAIASGAMSDHTCALTAGGVVLCWGRNDSGQLGDGTRSAIGRGRALPAAVAGLEGVSWVAVQDSTCVDSAGVVMCWGAGALGGSLAPRVAAVPRFTAALAMGGGHWCALSPTGSLTCEGRGTSGQLGDGSVHDAIAVVAGGDHTCAIRKGGGVACWGSWSTRGDGTSSGGETPSAVHFIDDAERLAAGTNHVCALRRDGSVWCWGVNWGGRVNGTPCAGTALDCAALEPVQVPGVAGAVALGAGNTESCAVLGDGGVRCWGGRSSDWVLGGLTATREVVVGSTHACALDALGVVRCWGTAASGELGDGTTVGRNTPAPIAWP